MLKKTFDLRKQIIDFFNDYSLLLSETKYKTKIWKRSQNINSQTNASKITNSTYTSKSR